MAFRARKSPWPMLPVDDALNLINDSLPKRSTFSTVPVSTAREHVLGEAVHAREHVPNYRASVKDGYAVLASDGPGVYRVSNVSQMGVGFGERRLESGTVVRVTTGEVQL